MDTKEIEDLDEVPFKIVYLRLVSGEQVVAQLLGGITEEIDHYIFRYPMLIENQNIQGMPALNLSKYLPFDPRQILLLKKDHIVCISLTHETFCRYYENAIQYQENFLEPQNQANLERVNEHMEFALSDSNRQFTETMMKYKDKISQVPSGIQ